MLWNSISTIIQVYRRFKSKSWTNDFSCFCLTCIISDKNQIWCKGARMSYYNALVNLAWFYRSLYLLPFLGGGGGGDLVTRSATVHSAYINQPPVPISDMDLDTTQTHINMLTTENTNKLIGWTTSPYYCHKTLKYNAK